MIKNDIELVKDINLILQYLQAMRDTQDKKELNRYNALCRKKLEQIYKDKKELLKEMKEESRDKKPAKKAKK